MQLKLAVGSGREDLKVLEEEEERMNRRGEVAFYFIISVSNLVQILLQKHAKVVKA